MVSPYLTQSSITDIFHAMNIGIDDVQFIYDDDTDIIIGYRPINGKTKERIAYYKITYQEYNEKYK